MEQQRHQTGEAVNDPYWPQICSVCRNQNPVFSSWLTYHRVCNKSNTTSVICGAGTAHSSGAHEFTPCFSGISVARSLVFCVVICTSLFVLLSDFLFAVVLCVPLRFTASITVFECQPLIYRLCLKRHRLVTLRIQDVTSSVIALHCMIVRLEFECTGLRWRSIIFVDLSKMNV